MKNKIEYISKSSADIIKENAQQDGNVFLAEFYGNKATNEEDFMRQFYTAFNFPAGVIETQLNIGWFNDYVKDLLWIKEPSVIMLIYNYDDLLKHDLQKKKIWLDELESIVLPWWEGDVVGHMVGGKPRYFMVYFEKYA